MNQIASVASKTQKGSMDLRKGLDMDLDNSQNTSIVTENDYILEGSRKKSSKLQSLPANDRKSKLTG